jgi:hypothetical protein
LTSSRSCWPVAVASAELERLRTVPLALPGARPSALRTRAPRTLAPRTVVRAPAAPLASSSPRPKRAAPAAAAARAATRGQETDANARGPGHPGPRGRRAPRRVGRAAVARVAGLSGGDQRGAKTSSSANRSARPWRRQVGEALARGRSRRRPGRAASASFSRRGGARWRPFQAARHRLEVHEITPRSFHWLGDALAPDGTTWFRVGEFLVTRVG